MRKIGVALFLCFLLLFAALWYIPPATERNEVYQPLGKTDEVINDFLSLTMNSKQLENIQKEKLRIIAVSTRGTTSFPGKEDYPGTKIPRVVLPWMKNNHLSKMLLSSAKHKMWSSTGVSTQQPKVQTQQPKVQTQQPKVQTQKPKVETQQPKVQTQKPKVQTQKPKVETQQPKVQTQKPKVQTQKPKVETQQPKVQTQKPKLQRVLIVFWSTWFGTRLDLDESWTTSQCPVQCKITSDVSRAKDANAFIVHARDPYPLPPRNNVPWILYTQENPVYTPVLRQDDYMSKFKLLKSYRLDSDFPDPTFTVPNFTAPIPFKSKTGFIMAAFSNCERVRMEYMRQLMQFVKVDSYGACHKTAWGLIHRDGSVDFREQKTELARKYKFLLVFFNQDCDYFVDDQLLHALNAGTIPVVMGTDKIDQFMPGNLRHAYLNVRNFTNPKRLAEYLEVLGNNEAEYNKYLEWKFKGFGDIDGTIIGKHFHPPLPPYCQVCVAIAKGEVHEEGLKSDHCNQRRFEDWNIRLGATKEELNK